MSCQLSSPTVHAHSTPTHWNVFLHPTPFSVKPWGETIGCLANGVSANDSVEHTLPEENKEALIQNSRY